MKLFVVSTYYHTLISCVKQLNGKQSAGILVTDYIPDGKDLTERLEGSNLFQTCRFIKSPNAYQPKNRLDYIFNLHQKNAALIEK